MKLTLKLVAAFICNIVFTLLVMLGANAIRLSRYYSDICFEEELYYDTLNNEMRYCEIEEDEYAEEEIEVLPEEALAEMECTVIDIVEDSRLQPAQAAEATAEECALPSVAQVAAEENIVIEQPVQQVDENRVFDAVEVMPTFPGGQEALMRHLSRYLTYPTVAAENGIQGTVTVQFVVKRDGSVGDVRVVRGKDPDLDREAVRVVRTLPRFNPGYSNGVPVNVWYTLPVRFKLQQ